MGPCQRSHCILPTRAGAAGALLAPDAPHPFAWRPVNPLPGCLLTPQQHVSQGRRPRGADAVCSPRMVTHARHLNALLHAREAGAPGCLGCGSPMYFRWQAHICTTRTHFTFHTPQFPPRRRECASHRQHIAPASPHRPSCMRRAPVYAAGIHQSRVQPVGSHRAGSHALLQCLERVDVVTCTAASCVWKVSAVNLDVSGCIVGGCACRRPGGVS